MTFPFEQVVAIADANRQLALKFFDIARTTGARQVATGTQALGTFFEPARFPEVVEEVAQNRQALIADTKAAFEEWRENAGDVFSPGRETAQLAMAFEPLRAFLLAPLEAFARLACRLRTPRRPRPEPERTRLAQRLRPSDTVGAADRFIAVVMERERRPAGFSNFIETYKLKGSSA